MENIKEEIEKILSTELPGFWHKVSERSFMGSKSLAIQIAACDKLINGVSEQRPQAVSLSLDTQILNLKPQAYGGSGGRRIYRNIRPNDPKERYLAMQGIDIHFRRPKPEIAAVLKAIQTFARNYKAVLAENYAELRYHDLVDYDQILNS